MNLVMVRYCRLSKIVIWWGRWLPSRLWMFLVESGKDRFLRVDLPGQHVMPCV
jgi:hypothetical protein